MKKPSKPGDMFNAFQAKKVKHMKKKKSYSESDMGNVKKGGYDPNLGMTKSGYAKATATPKSAPFKLTTKNAVGGRSNFGGVGGIQGGNKHNANSTEFKRKHSKKHKKNWIAGAIKKPGALHRELGVKKGNKIPAKTLAKAAKKGGKEGKRARLAQNLKGFHKK